MDTDSPLILVVDDDRSLRMLFRVALEEEGYQVAEASNGAQACIEVPILQPDIVMLDAVMSAMDGFTCCSRLRELPAAKFTPILMITVLDDRDSVDKAFEAGATDYVTKPIHWAVLRQRVARLLDSERALKEVSDLADRLEKQTQRERLFRNLARRLSQSLTLEEMLQPSVAEIRQFLAADKLILYHKSGNFAIESTALGETVALNSERSGGKGEVEHAKELERDRVVAIADVGAAQVPKAAIERCQKLNVQAALMATISVRGKLWGLLEAHQSAPRQWETAEEELLADVANLMAIAIGQSR